MMKMLLKVCQYFLSGIAEENLKVMLKEQRVACSAHQIWWFYIRRRVIVHQKVLICAIIFLSISTTLEIVRKYRTALAQLLGPCIATLHYVLLCLTIKVFVRWPCSMLLKHTDASSNPASGIHICPLTQQLFLRLHSLQPILSTSGCSQTRLVGMYWRHTAFINNLLTKRLARRKYSQIWLSGIYRIFCSGNWSKRGRQTSSSTAFQQVWEGHV
jgi:hypothetical protein